MGIYLTLDRLVPGKESVCVEPDWWEHKAYDRMALGDLDHRNQVDIDGERYFRPADVNTWREEILMKFENQEYWLKVLDLLDEHPDYWLRYD